MRVHLVSDPMGPLGGWVTRKQWMLVEIPVIYIYINSTCQTKKLHYPSQAHPRIMCAVCSSPRLDSSKSRRTKSIHLPHLHSLECLQWVLKLLFVLLLINSIFDIFLDSFCDLFLYAFSDSLSDSFLIHVLIHFLNCFLIHSVIHLLI